jgi:hypothetical protein
MNRLAPLLLTACAPSSIVGDWAIDGFVVDGVTSASGVEGELAIDEDLEGFFEIRADGSALAGRAEAAANDDGTWDLDLTAGSDVLMLGCEIDEDALDCDAVQEGVTYLLTAMRE